VAAGDGIVITGTGTPRNPYVVNSTAADIVTGFNVQYNNVDVIRGVHALDFRGSAVHIDPGTDEAVVTVTVPDPTTGALLPPGMIAPFGMSNPPAGWLLCNGRTDLPISTYPNLAAALGTTYGGDGISTFGVPNLVGAFPLGTSGTYPMQAAQGGSSTKTIQVGNLPPHSHTINHNHASFSTGDSGTHDHAIHSSGQGGNNATVSQGTTGGGNFKGPIQGDGSHKHSIDVPNYQGGSGVAGSGTAMDVMPPYVAVAYMIKT